jgi:transposase
VALDYSKLADDPQLLKQLLLQHSHWLEALRSEVLRLRRWRFGRSSEVIDVSVSPELPLDGGEMPPVQISTTDLSQPIRVPTRLQSVQIGTQREKPRPARMLPSELPRVTCVHKPANCDCPDCGKPLRALGEDSSEQLDYVPGYFRVIRHVRPKLVCHACARIVQAPASTRPIERGLPTAGLLAQVIAAKYADHLPLYRQEGIYRRGGIELPRAMLASWVAESARLLDPLVGELQRHVLSASKLHADDTVVPVLSPGKGRTRTARLWAYVRDDRPSSGPDPPAVFYRYSPDRRAEHPQAHLRSFAGILQADAYSGFNALYASGRIVEAACWAHARRKYYDVYLTDRSPIAAEALSRIGELYAIEREIRGQTPNARRQVRMERSSPKLAQLHAWLSSTQRALSAKSPLGSAIQYSLTLWQQLTRYAEDGCIEIDNNAAERAIRALVLGRRNYLFAGSDAGGESAARLYSLIGTCRLNDIDPHLYLAHVLERIATHPINRIAELLPWRVALQLLRPVTRAA